MNTITLISEKDIENYYGKKILKRNYICAYTAAKYANEMKKLLNPKQPSGPSFPTRTKHPASDPEARLVGGNSVN